MSEASVYGIFCRQLAVIMRANVGPHTALKICHDQIENRKLKKLIGRLIEDVSKGDKISDAMKKQGEGFPMVMISAVEGAEKNGNWDEAMVRLAELFETQATLYENSKRATLIPLAIVVACLCMLSLIVLQVIPHFLSMFNGIEFDLPKITLAIVSVSTFVGDYCGYIALIVATLIIIWSIFSFTRSGKNVNAGIRMRLPLTGRINRQKLYALFCKMLSTLLKNGMPMQEAVRVMEDSIGENDKVRSELLKAAERVAEGMSLAKALGDSKLFSPMILQMTAIGEESGSLTDILDDMADYYETCTVRDSHRKIVYLETIAVVFLGVIMCIVIAAMVNPMLEFYDMISGM